ADKERGNAAHLATLSSHNYVVPADEHAARYAALISFMDDPSVKVRATLAYGLLHTDEAPRPIILSLLRDSPIISRAVLQYSPVLVDADLAPIVAEGDLAMLLAIAQRNTISPRIGAALLARGDHAIKTRLLRRDDIAFAAEVLEGVATVEGQDAAIRGALLSRSDLPATARMLLVQRVTESLRNCRLIKGSLASDRLQRLLRDGTDTAISAIGEVSAV